MPEKVVILGAGPTGLSCAYQLLEKGNFEVVVIDKAPYTGGFGASFEWKGYILDFGPHAFHRKGGRPEVLIRDLFNNDPENLIEGKKNVSVYLRGKFYKYPLHINEVLKKFNLFLSMRIFIEFMFTSIFHALVSVPIENFEAWGCKRFGPTLYKLGFGDYTEKVWKTKASHISTKFASEKIQGFSFVNLIKKLFKFGGEVTEPYFQEWLYPRKGSGEIYKRLTSRIKEKGGSVILDAKPYSINIEEDKIKSIDYIQAGKKYSIRGDYVISTIPLGALGKRLSPPASFFVSYSFQKLKYISLIVVYLEFDKDKISDKDWFYLPDKSFRFNRVAEQKNLCRDTFKNGKTVLSLEITCRYGDELWCKGDEEIVNMAKEDISRFSFINPELIIDALVKRFPDAYEIYYKNFAHHADVSISYIRSVKNLFSIGRRGLFLQGDQYLSVEMGLEMADIFAEAKVNDTSLERYYKKYLKYIDYL